MTQALTLNDVIEELLDKGYSPGCDMAEQAMPAFHQDCVQQLPTQDFTIDEVYCCRENNYSQDIVYVFAVSSQKYEMKGIVINLIEMKKNITLKEVYKKVKNAFRYFRGWLN